MFTGIITHLARIEKLTHGKKDLELQLSLLSPAKRKLTIGCSICCSGICLTLIKKSGLKLWFQVSDETISKSSVKNWQVGKLINIEFSLRLADELGGHLVLGHVDGTAQLTKITEIDECKQLIFKADPALVKMIAAKGSLCLDGISLTVNHMLDSTHFDVNLISHTLKTTAFSELKVGDLANLEIDVIARYVANQLNK